MAQTVSFQAPSEYGVEMQEIERRRKYAELLQQQSMEPVQGAPTPPGGFAVPISWTQGLAKVLQGYSARKGMEDASAQQKALGERYTADRGADMARIMRAGQGTPASSNGIMDEQANDGMGQMAQINAPAVPGSNEAMLAAMGSSRFTDRQDMAAVQQIAQMNRPPIKTDLGDRWKVEYGDGRVTFEPKAPTPDALLRQVGENQRHGAPSGSAILSNQGAMERHAAPSGSAILSNQGAMQRHATPSGSAVLGANTTLQTHATPSGSAILNSQAAGAQGLGKPSPGYRWKPDGSQEPVPGGPKDMTVKNKAIAETTAIKGKIVVDAVDQALANVGMLTTGLTGTVLGAIPGTSAYDLEGTLDTIKANIGFNELQAMRQASPTGGALGQVAVRELDMLQAVLASLKKGQSEPKLVDSLKKVKTHYSNWKSAVDQAAVLEGGPAIQTAPARRATDNAPAVAEGATASGPGGQKIIFRNGAWVPM